ncbi:MAG: methionine aminotransferase [Bacteroidia bacterium]
MINSKLPNIGTTIFTKMSALARAHNAINLSQGFPDFEVDELLSDLLFQASKEGFSQYAPMEGLLSLREKISEKYKRLYQADYSPNDVTITAGATQAIFTAIASIIHKGDEVIIFTPAYDCYVPTVELFGGICKFVSLKSPNFSVDWDVFDKQLSSKTKLVIINTPHNPTGSILQKSDLQILEEKALEHNFLVLSDEVYEHIIFDGEKHQSACMFPELKKRSFIVASFGKTFHITGWKMGYCIAPEALMKEFRKVHQFNVFCVNHPAQKALNDYFEMEKFEMLSNFYQQKRDYFLSIISNKNLTFLDCKGTYFCVADFSKISNLSDVEFCEWMTKEKRLAAIPLSVFYNDFKDEKLIRLCFAKQENTLKKAAEILNEL